MNLNKLLIRQLNKFIPEDLRNHPAMDRFLQAISESYDSYERDNELSNRAFSISEQEYKSLNEKLLHESQLREISIRSLKESVKELDETYQSREDDDLIDILHYLKFQIAKRAEAENELIATANRLSSLIQNIQAGILVESESRKVILTNNQFCNIFMPGISFTDLIGADCSNAAEQSKHLATDPETFVQRIQTIVQDKKLVINEEISFADGRFFERDYIPVYINNEYKGHLWKYRDITINKKIRDDIAESEKKHRLILNAALDAIVHIDIQGIIRFWNPQAETIFGWKAEEVTGKDMAAIIIPENYREAHRQGMTHFLQTGTGPVLNKPLEITAINRQGSVFPVELAIIPIREKENIFFCGFIRDISARKKAEEKVKANEELLQFALEGAGDGIWEFNFETRKTYYSEHNKVLAGYDPDETVPDWLELLHPEDIYIFETLEKDYLDGRIQLHKKEYRIRHKNGHYTWILDRGRIVSRDETGKPLRLVGTHTDITNRKQAEQSLLANEEKYRSIIANMNLGLMEVNLDEIILFANNSFCEMSGYNPQELIGKKAAELFVRGANAEIAETKNEKRKAGISDAYEIGVTNKNGEQKWWLVSGAPRYDDQDRLVGSIGIHLDITAQKNLELELLDARESAEQSAAAKEIFLANMSHEIRTPMNAIIGMGRQLHRTSLNDQQQFYLETINKAAEHLLVLINDILDISKIEAGKLNLEYIGFRPDEVINHCIQVMEHKAEEKGLKLLKENIPDKSTVFLGDPYRLTQILLNLLSNAIKFTEEGKVTVSCLMQPVINKRQLIILSVKDTGIGMDAEFLNSIFRKFTQEEQSTARKYGGTGLGMSISKQLTELMDGQIEVSSQKGEGSTVTLTIPFAVGAEEDVPQSKGKLTDSSILKDKKILLVEDNEMNRLVATTLLENYGVQIEEVFNGAEAVRELKNNYYDLVLMDVQMPVLNGLDATRIIRQDINQFVPIIALTANAIKGEAEKCLKAGMNDYISKPFEEEELINAIARWLGEGPESFTPNQSSVMEIKPTTPLYELVKLERIAQNNKAFILKMVTLFSRQAPADVREIEAAFKKQDYNTVRSVAHRMKPSIDNMGIVSLHELIREIELFNESDTTTSQLEAKILLLRDTISQVTILLQHDVLENSDWKTGG